MITPMQKLTLVCMDADRNQTLHRLQEIGVLHLAPVTPPESDDLAHAKKRLHETRHARNVLRAHTPTTETARGTESGTDSPAEIVSRVADLVGRVEKLAEERASLAIEHARLSPYGNFSPDQVRTLARAGIPVRLFHETENHPIEPPEEAALVVLNETDRERYVAIIGKGDIGGKAHELAPPGQSLGEVEARLSAIDREQASIEETLRQTASRVDVLADYERQIEDTVNFAEARAGMGSATRLAYLQGFCPKDRVDQVRDAATRSGWGLAVDEPAATDTVPTLIRSPLWVRPIKAVLDVIKITPGYREQDISPVFLIFFTIFFAMLIGDAGYGLIFLALTGLARLKMKKAPAYPFAMLTVLSACTIVWGTLTGNYFGIPSQYAPLRAFQIDWLNQGANVMKLCFTIGAIHMTIAHVWRFMLLIPSRKALEQVGWIIVLWTMFFYARQLVAGVPAPSFTLPMLMAGILLIALFMCTTRAELKAEAINLVMLPLSIVSALVDVISYIRLFAVGMASLAVAESFNGMALGIGFDHAVSGFFASLIIVLGHTLNIVLCGLAVLVHGVRLNTLEFSMHMGMEWSGVPFRPFKRIAKE